MGSEDLARIDDAFTQDPKLNVSTTTTTVSIGAADANAEPERQGTDQAK